MYRDNREFQILSQEDVISVKNLDLEGEIIPTATFTVNELRTKIPALFECDTNHSGYKWCDAGVEGRILMAEKGGGWKKGRIRFSIEFLPDVPEQNEDNSHEKLSPELDEFR
jgi:hypothetical protein